jgi:hypothetical protein
MRVPNRQVFINCPFDENYSPLLEAAVFTILACGYTPRCAREFGDTGYDRLSRITDLIDQCDFSLHDISLTELDAGTGLPRFNMAFELGIAWGRKRRRTDRKLLVIDRALHRHERSISDLKALDPVSHEGDPLEMVAQVRNWLSSPQNPLNGPKHMKDWHLRFQMDLPDICSESGFDRSRMAQTFNDLVYCAVLWLNKNVPIA